MKKKIEMKTVIGKKDRLKIEMSINVVAFKPMDNWLTWRYRNDSSYYEPF